MTARGVRTRRRQRAIAALALLLVVPLAGTAASPVAAAAAAEQRRGGWRFEIAPYLWVSEVHGDVTIRDRSADFEVGFDDIFDLLGDGDLFSAAGHFEARHDRLAFFLDALGTVVDEETDGEIARQDVDVDLDTDIVTVELGVAYRFLEHGRFSFEGLAGGRYNYWFTEISADVADRERSRDASQEFIDPFVGGRGAVRLAEQLALVFRGDVGGFGAGSELAWVVLGGVLWEMPWSLGAADLAAFMGYKVYDLDYETGAGGSERKLDLQLRGPAIGMIFTF